MVPSAQGGEMRFSSGERVRFARGRASRRTTFFADETRRGPRPPLVLRARRPSAQSDGFDPETVAMTFHKVSGAPLDTPALAAQSQAAMRASGFDRPDVIAAEQQRLDAQLASMNPAQEFTIAETIAIRDLNQ